MGYRLWSKPSDVSAAVSLLESQWRRQARIGVLLHGSEALEEAWIVACSGEREAVFPFLRERPSVSWLHPVLGHSQI